MQIDNKLFDDLAKLATGGVGTLMDIKRELETMVSAHMEKLLARMNLVSRDEFDAVRAMAIASAERAEALAARLDALEAKVNK